MPRSKIVLALAVMALPYVGNAGPHRLPGSDDMSQLMSQAALVFKGIVSEVQLDGGKVQGVKVQVSKIYKGELKDKVVDVTVESASELCAVPENGRAVLLFAKVSGGKIAIAECPRDIWPASKKLRGKSGKAASAELEDDLRADLRDAEGKDALAAIRQLGNMKSRGSVPDLKRLLDSADLDIRAGAVRSLLKLGDYSGLKFVDGLQGKKFQEWLILAEIDGLISGINNKAAVPELLALSKSEHIPSVRAAVGALRAIKSPASAQRLVELLDHPNRDIEYAAMATLDEMEHGESAETPTTTAFAQAPDRYVSQWKAWWGTSGRKKYSK